MYISQRKLRKISFIMKHCYFFHRVIHVLLGSKPIRLYNKQISTEENRTSNKSSLGKLLICHAAVVRGQKVESETLPWAEKVRFSLARISQPNTWSMIYGRRASFAGKKGKRKENSGMWCRKCCTNERRRVFLVLRAFNAPLSFVPPKRNIV